MSPFASAAMDALIAELKGHAAPLGMGIHIGSEITAEDGDPHQYVTLRSPDGQSMIRFYEETLIGALKSAVAFMRKLPNQQSPQC